MAAPIPIRNIYYLLCYAWKRLDEGAIVDVSGVDSTELADLFGTVLTNGVRHLLRLGLDKDYELHEEELAAIRRTRLHGEQESPFVPLSPRSGDGHAGRPCRASANRLATRVGSPRVARPGFSPAFGCNAASTPASCVAFGRAPRRTGKYACVALAPRARPKPFGLRCPSWASAPFRFEAW